jgi:beta-mannosidase
MNEDINRRIMHEVFDECKARFVSEYGVIGPCDLMSVKKYLNKGELYIGSRAWREHTNTYEKETTPAGIKRHYADPENLSISDYILYGQMFQATLYGRTLEALRFRKHDPKDDCQGALIWMYNDCWGETGWTPIDYYLRRKPSYYWIRNAFSPVKAIVRKRGNDLVTRVVNDTLKQLETEIRYGWMRIDGSDSSMKSKAIRMDANGMVEIAKAAIPARKMLNPEQWIYAAYLDHKDLDLCPSVWLLRPYRDLAVPDPEISITVEDNTVRLISKTYCHGVHYRDHGKGVFSDNYFDLLPGVPKSIKCLVSKMPGKIQFQTI